MRDKRGIGTLAAFAQNGVGFQVVPRGRTQSGCVKFTHVG